MQVLRLDVRHVCPFSSPTDGEARARVAHLCHRGEEATLEIRTGTPEEMRKLLGRYETLGGEVVLRSEEEKVSLVRFPTCLCCRRGQVIPTLESEGHLFLPPSLYAPSGSETYQFLLKDPGLGPDMLNRLRTRVTVETLAIRPLQGPAFEGDFLIPLRSLVEGLTDRQREALTLALRRGYYRIPRAIHTEDLASRLGISREAFEALLRKAENRLLHALLPYLGSPPPRSEEDTSAREQADKGVLPLLGDEGIGTTKPSRLTSP
jgi:predicted DNA binding protein